jgi:WD40 repeat protein
MQELIAHENNYVLKCQFSLDSKLLATCSSDKTCVVWELVSDVNAGVGDGVDGE